MKVDLLTNLPGEITREIVGRLPDRSTKACKRVCKSWRHLIEGNEFESLYIRKPCLPFPHEHEGCAVCDEAFDIQLVIVISPMYN